MNPTKVMINGLPGNVAQVIAQHTLDDERFALVPFSLTGPEIDFDHCHIKTMSIELIKPEQRNDRLPAVKASEGEFITIDFTHPTAVNDNADYYCRQRLPFVMGTTGGDRDRLTATVTQSDNVAVIAPNMAKQIVGLQAMISHAATHFPNLFKGYQLTVRESHQSGKADTSGTAKAIVADFNRMGVVFDEAQIRKERDPERQSTMWGIPPEYLSGHGWHTYTLISADKTVKFEFTHNINGREIYAEGTLDAVLFLKQKMAKGAKGQVFSMVDVLKEGL